MSFNKIILAQIGLIHEFGDKENYIILSNLYELWNMEITGRGYEIGNIDLNNWLSCPK